VPLSFNNAEELLRILKDRKNGKFKAEFPEAAPVRLFRLFPDVSSSF